MNIKVCGMRDHSNIAAVSRLMPDYLGFIFYPQSPRYVGEDFKMPDIDPSITKVGVFVDETTEGILAATSQHGITAVQLHGHESVQQCEQLRKNNLLIIKVFSVDDEFDFTQTKDYAGSVDFFLFDTKGKYFGGNARRFNWSVLRKYDQKVPFFLSGGLAVDNVQDIKSLDGMNVHAVDLNSGVEDSPGVKNIKKLQNIKEILVDNNIK